MKNFLVIGGSSGIGLSVVNQLREAGHQVYATFCSHPQESASGATYYHLDVKADTIDLSFLPEVLDGLVYCPGIINLKPFARLTPEDFIADYKLQVAGAVSVIQQALPHLKRAETASIVLFSTVAVQTGFNFHTVVSSSKGAIEGFMRALAAELAPKIRVNCIAPSITDTPLAAHLLNTPEKREATAQRQPMRRLGKPEEVAAAACFLLSDASSWTTGQVLHVDGGMSSLKI
jgi:NAD(P)-dependent dehydrogenase (short-subunit alcohol dehydrogenase family)